MNKELTRPSHYTVILACLAVGCTQSGISMYASSLPFLSKMFDTKYKFAVYTLTAYLLGYAFAVLIFGGLSDQVGRKKIYILCAALFTITSAILAFTNSILVFILIRFIQGLGGGGCAVIARTSVQDVYKNQKLVSAMASISISFIISLGFFQLLGSIFQTYGNYKYDFIFMSIYGLLLIYLICTLYDETRSTSSYTLDSNKLILAYYVI